MEVQAVAVLILEGYEEHLNASCVLLNPTDSKPGGENLDHLER